MENEKCGGFTVYNKLVWHFCYNRSIYKTMNIPKSRIRRYIKKNGLEINQKKLPITVTSQLN